MKESTAEFIMAGVHVALFSMFAFAGFSVGHGNGRDATRREAIEAGVAQWTVDPKTGATTFEWRKCE